MLPETQAWWNDKVQNVTTAVASSPLPIIDAHDLMAATKQWAEDDTECPPPPTQPLTETIHKPKEAVSKVGAFMWQHTTSEPVDRPAGVLYEVMQQQQQDMLPCREWMFLKQDADCYVFSLSKSGGLQPNTKRLWGPPTQELTNVSNQVLCYTCVPVTLKCNTQCKHKRVCIPIAQCPVNPITMEKILALHM
jgi:hypothetical protein